MNLNGIVKFFWPYTSRTREADFVNDVLAKQLEGERRILNHLAVPKDLYDTQEFSTSGSHKAQMTSRATCSQQSHK